MNELENIKEALELVAFQAKRAIQYVMESERGINPKVGFNTLDGSRLWNEIGIDMDDWGLIQLLVNDYIEYVERGRKPGTFPPPKAIAEWCSRKGIPNDNKTVYAICMSIYKYGIAPRPIMDKAEEMWDSYWNEWADGIFQTLLLEINDYFSD